TGGIPKSQDCCPRRLDRPSKQATGAGGEPRSSPPGSETVMLNLVSMRTRASFVLWMVALAQIILLGPALGFLQLRRNDLSHSLARLGNEEQAFLHRLADIESDLYRISILIRDNIIIDGPAQQQARRELIDRLNRISAGPIEQPAWVSPSLRTQVT